MDTMNCPKCSQPLQITPPLRGLTVQCTKCSHQFMVPAAEAEAPQPLKPPAPQAAEPTAGPAPQTAAPEASSAAPQAASSQASQGPRVMAPGAVASLIFGILGFCICGIIFGLLAVSKGKQARDLCRENPGEYSGEGLALAGIILGWIGFALTLIVLVVRLVMLAAGK